MDKLNKLMEGIKKLNKDGDIFQGQHWCNGCRDWYEKELTQCPDCNPNPIKSLGINDLQKNTLKSRTHECDEEVKKDD